MSRCYRKGQSTLEYVLLVTAVIVIIIGLVVTPGSPFRTTVNRTFSDAINGVGIMADKLNASH